MSEVIVRFAPSPTGLLHVGNARTAMLNWLFAKKVGGKFLLRIDDTDFERSKIEFERAIYQDLQWLFQSPQPWSGVALQSTRSMEYQNRVEHLKADGYLYPCYETADELERRRKRLAAMHRAPVYDRAALKLSAEDRAKLEAEGRKPHWRFKLSQTKVTWRDQVRGEVEIDTAHLSDPVLIREDGRFLYTLPSVVDDIDFHVSHIVRGEDHVTNTAAQIEIFEALGAAIPHFAHFPLLVGTGGEALSKRIGSLSLREIRESGIEPLALASYLAKTGTSDPIELKPSLETLAAEFAFEKVGRAPAHFDPRDLRGLNSKLLHSLPVDRVADRLSALGISTDAAFWDAVKANISELSDATVWWRVVAGPVEPVRENPIRDDIDIPGEAAKFLPPEPWDENTWGEWTKAVSQATGEKGRALFHPLRLALTGRPDGPELKKLLPLIGRAKSLARLKGDVA